MVNTAASLFRWSLALTSLASATACESIPPLHADGRYLTTRHGTARFDDALQGAREYCAKLGLGVRHLGTDISGRALSRFECVESKQ